MKHNLVTKLRDFFQRIPLPVLVVAGVSLALLIFLFVFPRWHAAQIRQRIELQNKKPISQQEIFELENKSLDNILKILQTIGGLGFVFTGYFAWKNLKVADKNRELAEKNRELAEDKQITERFSKAVELLSDSSKLEARIGGIYLLERIARDSPNDYWTVMEVLTAYIRDKSKVRGSENLSITTEKEEVVLLELAADIQAALRVVGRGDLTHDELNRLNLMTANLQGADLRWINLDRARLYGAQLSQAHLAYAHLSGADLRNADFSGANLAVANLSGAKLDGANFSEARFDETNFQGAYLTGVDFSQLDLDEINLVSVDLMGAKLSGVDLHGQDLSGAKLHGADLSGANLSKVNLSEGQFIVTEQFWSLRL